MEELSLDKIKSFSVFAIPFFTVCGGLYHIAYWDTFGLNGLEYLDFVSLLKSFIYPFVGFSIIQFVFASFFFQFKEDVGFMPHGAGRTSNVGVFLNKKIVIAFFSILWFFATFMFYFRGGTYRWIQWSLLATIFPSLYLDRIGFLKSKFGDTLVRIRLIKSFVYVLVFSFGAGKYQSQIIHDNVKFKYTVQKSGTTILKTDTLKLIAMSSDKLFFTDLGNSKIIILNSNKVDTMVLFSYSIN